MVLLTALKKVGDLQAFSVSEAYLEFFLAYSYVILRPQPSYVPKVPTTPFWDQLVNLQALNHDEAHSALSLLCPVHTLHIYLDCPVLPPVAMVVEFLPCQVELLIVKSM